MFWSAPARCAQLLLVLCLAACSVGCPELNSGTAPGYLNDPFTMNNSDDINEPGGRAKVKLEQPIEPTELALAQ